MASYERIYYDDSAGNYRENAKRMYDSIPSILVHYFTGLLPIVNWLPQYNLNWLVGDLIAGITVGAVVVPQGMAYAKIATLPVQYGLYSSIAGVFVYCFFATSKDITIGPVAVMSLLLAQILTQVGTKYSHTLAAATLALLCGFVAAFLGIFRLGFIIDFISGPAIAGFMSGSALTIAIGQIAGLFGIPNINTRAASYQVLGFTLGHLGNAHMDAAFGLTGIAFLYAIRSFSEYAAKKWPKKERFFFFLNTTRSVVLVIVSTFAAWLLCRNLGATTPIKLNGTVPSGLHAVQTPSVDHGVISALAPNIPVAVLILILEHVAIAKSFGRLNDYVINPSQELIAIGIANIIGSFFGAYPSTGSFSRTAVKARAGVKTPLAGIFTGLVVLLALYAFTPAFYFIPNATLAAIIIHAVGDLFSGPKIWRLYWEVSPFEFFIFWIGVIITFFTTVEIGIYVTVGLSLLILLTKIARPRLMVLGRVPINSKIDEIGAEPKYVYVPVDHQSVKARVEIQSPTGGVVIIRLEESYTYPNASTITDQMIAAAKAVTRRGAPVLPKNQRPWNDTSKEDAAKSTYPILRAVVVDFIAVAHFDSTALQGLTNARATLDRYAGEPVEWHFANVTNARHRLALQAAGFGGQTPRIVDTNSGSIVPTLNERQDEDNLGSLHTSGNIRQTREIMVPRESFMHYELDDAVKAASLAAKGDV